MAPHRRRSARALLLGAMIGTAGLMPFGLLPMGGPGPVAAAESLFGTNLIVNGNAEAGAGSVDGSVVPVPGWTTTGGFTVVQYQTFESVSGFPDLFDMGPDDRGANFFAGGPTSSSSTATQDIDVSAAGPVISNGGVTYDLRAWLGGKECQPDRATLFVDFLDNAGNWLTGHILGGFSATDRSNNTGMRFAGVPPHLGFDPQRTQTIRVTLLMERLDDVAPCFDDYNDGYADSLSLVMIEPHDSDLVLQHTAAPTSIAVGQTVTHTLTVRNDGPLEAEEANLTASWSADNGLELVSFSASQGTCVTFDTTVQCTLGVMPNNAEATVDVVLRATLEGAATVVAQVSSVDDPNTSNNNSELTTPITGFAATCQKRGSRLLVTVSDSQVRIVREGSLLVIEGVPTASHCNRATVDTVASVTITGSSGNETVIVDLSGGRLEPGAGKAEGSGISEIEITGSLDGGLDRLVVVSAGEPVTGTPGAVNLNGDDDADVTLSGVEELEIRP